SYTHSDMEGRQVGRSRPSTPPGSSPRCIDSAGATLTSVHVVLSLPVRLESQHPSFVPLEAALRPPPPPKVRYVGMPRRRRRADEEPSVLLQPCWTASRSCIRSALWPHLRKRACGEHARHGGLPEAWDTFLPCLWFQGGG